MYKGCLFAKIDKPDDELMFAILLKNFSDRQITIEKKLIEFRGTGFWCCGQYRPRDFHFFKKSHNKFMGKITNLLY